MASPIPENPFVSVIIPCRNEAVHIRRCLDSLLRNEFPRERLEIKFVDGCSTDGTREILREASSRHPFIEVLDNPRMIVPVAMNLGIRRSRGDVIVRMDAHSEYPPDYIARCVALLKETNAGNAGGRVVSVPNGDGPWARAVAFVTGHKFGVGTSVQRTGERPGFVDSVPVGTFPRAVLEEVGLFDERLTRGQDYELNARIRRSGYKIAFDPTIRIHYFNRATLRGLARQGFYSSMWNVYILSLHPSSWRWYRFIPGAFVLYLALLAALAAGSVPWTPLAALPLGLYVALLAAASLKAGEGGGGAPRAALAFAAYHVCYGAGTHYGLVNRLTGRWRGHLGRPLSR